VVPIFSGETADEVWVKVARAITASDVAEQPSRAGPTRELLHAVLEILDPRQRWIPSRLPAVNPAFAIAEALWVLWGRNDDSLPMFFNPKFADFSGPGPVYAGAYGSRLRRAFGIDQLTRAADALAGKPTTRQVVLQIWDAAADIPNSDGSERRADIPCNVVSLLKVRDGRLHWTQVLRSNDIVLGVPHNVVQFTLLQEVLAGWLGIGVGPYTQLSDSLHAYARDLEDVKAVSLVPAMRSDDSLALSLRESQPVLRDLEERLNIMIRRDLDRSTFEKVASGEGLPGGYRNHFAVVSADAARRHGWTDLMERSVAHCANPALQQMWDRWLARKAVELQR
jgi:thymidylate synthase